MHLSHLSHFTLFKSDSMTGVSKLLSTCRTVLLTTGLAFGLLLPHTSNADTLAISAGGGIWNESASGNFQETTDPATVDVEENLFWDTESQNYLWVTFEHFVPIIPNVRISYTKLEHEGSGSTSFVYDGITYTGNIDNGISVETVDILLYYEVLDNIVSVDLGLNARQLDVNFDINDGTNSDTNDSSETIPMVYALVGFSPMPDLIVSGEMYYVSYDGSKISDVTAKIAYTTDFFVGVEAGFRSQKYELDDVDGTDADLTFEGPFVGAYLKF